MRIGILTFHCAHNYGAVLQAYALQEYLSGKGHIVEIIDYRPSYLTEPYRVKLFWFRFFSKNPIECMGRFLNESFYYLPMRYKRWFAFEHFIKKQLNLSAPIIGKQIPEMYDAYIVGSDQIWNPKLTGGIFDDVYFAHFNFEKGDKKYISYAASMGATTLSEDEKKHYLKRLVDFDKISVRENVLADLLQPLSNKPIAHVVDPTLLVGKDYWRKITKIPFSGKKYVLVYAITRDAIVFEKAKNLANQLNIEVIELTSGIVKEKGKYQTSSPAHFLGAIKNAEFVITTSFHATIFSILFNTPFYTVLLGGGENSRVSSLLKMLDLQERIKREDDIVMPETLINWGKTNELLEKIRKNSIDFINSFA